MDNDRRTLPEVAAAFARSGLKLTPALWKTLRDNRIVPPLKRISGSKRYGMTARDQKRLFHILTVKGGLEGRFKVSKLALKLAVEGDQTIPTKLVQAEVKSTIEKFLSTAHRVLMRQTHLRSANTYVMADIRRSAKLLSRKFLRNIRSEPRYHERRQALETLLVAILAQIYLELDVKDIQIEIESALEVFFVVYDAPGKRLGLSPPQLDALARGVVSMLRPMKPWFTRNKSRNDLLKSVNAATSDDLRNALRVVDRLQLVFESGIKKFTSGLPPNARPAFNSITAWDGFSDFVSGLMLAMLITMWSDSTALPVLNEIRSGSSPSSDSIFSGLALTVSNLTAIEKVRHDRTFATKSTGKPSSRR